MAHKLLLADDSITIQKVVELILTEEDFEIKATNNGEEAMAVVFSFKPDVILADIEMPKMNGYQLCEKIKQDPATRDIPVILLAGAFEPIDEELSKQVGADDYVVKPFESQELISKINAALTLLSVEEEEVEGIAEAEAVGIEEEVVEEELWQMEEIPKVVEWPAEEKIEVGIEEVFETAMDKGVTIEAPAPTPEEAIPHKIEKAVPTEAFIPEVELPSKDELKEMCEKAINDRLSSLLSSFDLKETILSSLIPLMRDSVEKILWEVTPDLVERMLKEMLKGSLESLSKEVEKVIWETVPDLAETMISKEIERLRSEF